MCWLYGHNWFWVGRDTGNRDICQCSLCGVTRPATTSVTIITTTTGGH